MRELLNLPKDLRLLFVVARGDDNGELVIPAEKFLDFRLRDLRLIFTDGADRVLRVNIVCLVRKDKGGADDDHEYRRHDKAGGVDRLAKEINFRHEVSVVGLVDKRRE